MENALIQIILQLIQIILQLYEEEEKALLRDSLQRHRGQVPPTDQANFILASWLTVTDFEVKKG